MSIRIQKRSVYGNDLVYPICDKAKLFAEIAEQKTLTPRVLMLIQSLGYSLEYVI